MTQSFFVLLSVLICGGLYYTNRSQPKFEISNGIMGVRINLPLAHSKLPLCDRYSDDAVKVFPSPDAATGIQLKSNSVEETSLIECNKFLANNHEIMETTVGKRKSNRAFDFSRTNLLFTGNTVQVIIPFKEVEQSDNE